MTEKQEAAVAAAGQSSESTAITLRAKTEQLVERVQQGLDAQAPRLQAYLAKLQGDPDRFRSTVLQAVATTPALVDCTPSSIVLAALDAAQLGLEPTGILGGAYMLPYKNREKRVIEAKLIVGYRGYIDLIHRAGAVESIEARVVYEGDEFEVEFGTQKKIRHVPYFLVGHEQGARRCVYWIAETAHETQFDVLPMAEIEKARKSSKSADRGPWIEWYDEMAKKTAIRRAVKILAISVYEARRAVQLEDEAEESSEPIARVAGTNGSSARDRAVALLDGGERESAPNDIATQGTAGDEPPPESPASPDTSEQESSRSGRPRGSEDSDEGLDAADAALDATLEGSRSES